MILVFNTEQEAIDCEAQISTVGASLYEQEGYSIIDGEVEIKEGKQRIERWAVPAKAFNVDKWYFASPEEKSPEHFADMVTGFAYEVWPAVPSDWIEQSEQA